MITEEDINWVRRKIKREEKKHPRVMFNAFCIVFADTVAKDFNEFIDGLDELKEKDRVAILRGMIERKGRFWENADLEEVYSMALRILEEYCKQCNKKKWRNKCPH